MHQTLISFKIHMNEKIIYIHLTVICKTDVLCTTI